MMKRSLSIILCGMLLLALTAVAQADALSDILARGKLVVGSEISFPPYEFYFENPETGEQEPYGFEMEMARGLAETLGVELVLADQSFSGLITALRAGEIDCIISALSINPERTEVVDFSDAYYGGTQIVLTRKEDVDKYKTPEDFAGVNLGAQTGSLQQRVAEEQFATANLSLLDRVPLLVLELRMGNIDGMVLTDSVALTYITLFPDELAISGVPVVYESPGAGIAVQKGDNETLLAAINDYIASIRADGTFDRWIDEAIALNAKLLDEELSAE